MITVRCPKCDHSFKTPNGTIGQKIGCPKCSTDVEVLRPAEVVSDAKPLAVAEVVAEELPTAAVVAEQPKTTPAKATRSPATAPKQSRASDFDMPGTRGGSQRPRPSSARPANRAPRANPAAFDDGPAVKSGNAGLVVGLILGILVLLGGGGALTWWLLNKDEGEKKPTEVADKTDGKNEPGDNEPIFDPGKKPDNNPNPIVPGDDNPNADFKFAIDPPPAGQQVKIKDELLKTFPARAAAVFAESGGPFVMLGSNARDAHIDLYNVATAKRVCRFDEELRPRMNSTAISPDGKTVVSWGMGAFDKKIQIWSGETGQKVHEVEGFPNGSTPLWVIPTAGQKLVLVSQTRAGAGKRAVHLGIWDTKQNRMSRQWQTEAITGFTRRHVAVSPGGKYIGIFGKTEVYMIDLETKEQSIARVPTDDLDKKYAGPAGVGMAFSPDGTELAAVIDVGGRWRIASWRVNDGVLTTLKISEALRDGASYDGPKLSWLPNKSGWLICGLHFVEYASGKIIRTIPSRAGSGMLAGKRSPRQIIGNVLLQVEEKGKHTRMIARPVGDLLSKDPTDPTGFPVAYTRTAGTTIGELKLPEKDAFTGDLAPNIKPGIAMKADGLGVSSPGPVSSLVLIHQRVRIGNSARSRPVVWNLATAKALSAFQPLQRPSFSLGGQLMPDGRYMYYKKLGGHRPEGFSTVQDWEFFETASGKLTATIMSSNYLRKFEHMVFAGPGKIAIFGGHLDPNLTNKTKRLVVVDIATQKAAASLDVPISEAWDPSGWAAKPTASAGGRYVAFFGGRLALRLVVFDTKTSKTYGVDLPTEEIGRTTKGKYLSFSPDGSHLLAVTATSHLHRFLCWNLETGKITSQWTGSRPVEQLYAGWSGAKPTLCWLPGNAGWLIGGKHYVKQGKTGSAVATVPDNVWSKGRIVIGTCLVEYDRRARAVFTKSLPKEFGGLGDPATPVAIVALPGTDLGSGPIRPSGPGTRPPAGIGNLTQDQYEKLTRSYLYDAYIKALSTDAATWKNSLKWVDSLKRPVPGFVRLAIGVEVTGLPPEVRKLKLNPAPYSRDLVTKFEKGLGTLGKGILEGLRSNQAAGKYGKLPEAKEGAATEFIVLGQGDRKQLQQAAGIAGVDAYAVIRVDSEKVRGSRKVVKKMTLSLHDTQTGARIWQSKSLSEKDIEAAKRIGRDLITDFGNSFLATVETQFKLKDLPTPSEKESTVRVDLLDKTIERQNAIANPAAALLETALAQNQGRITKGRAALFYQKILGDKAGLDFSAADAAKRAEILKTAVAAWEKKETE